MAANFEINDPTLKLALLTHLVQQIESSPGSLDQLLVSGVSGDLIDHLRSKATVSDLCRVAMFNRPNFVVSFDDPGLMACFEQLARVLRDEQLKEYLARNGASTELLSSWFSLSISDAHALRAALAPARTSGRPKLPEVPVRDAIHAAWANLPTGLSEREAYFDLHQQFGDISITALHQVIHEHDCVSSAVTRSRLGHRAGESSSAKAQA